MYWTHMAELFGRDTSSRSKSSGVSGGLFVSIKICSVCKMYVYAVNMLHSPWGGEERERPKMILLPNTRRLLLPSLWLFSDVSISWLVASKYQQQDFTNEYLCSNSKNTSSSLSSSSSSSLLDRSFFSCEVSQTNPPVGFRVAFVTFPPPVTPSSSPSSSSSLETSASSSSLELHQRIRPDSVTACSYSTVPIMYSFFIEPQTREKQN